MLNFEMEHLLISFSTYVVLMTSRTCFACYSVGKMLKQVTLKAVLSTYSNRVCPWLDCA